MKIAVVGNIKLKEEFLGKDIENSDIIWVDDVQQLASANVDVYIDLLFENEKQRVKILSSLLPKPVIINSVIDTLEEVHPFFVRMNGWPTFISSKTIEASVSNDEVKTTAEGAFSILGKKIKWVADEPGFITPRVVSMIINEAFFALQEGVSTPEEINTAMKLGTAYPFGPFEWAAKIGAQNIVTLLQKLSAQQNRYKPCELLVQETDKAI